MKDENSQVLINFLGIIEGISSVKYQKRVWIEGRGPECDDFDETVNCFFDDGTIVINDYKKFGITEKQHLLLKSFWDEFRIFADKHDWPQDFVDTPEWTKITEMAKEVLMAFHWKMPVQDSEN